MAGEDIKQHFDLAEQGWLVPREKKSLGEALRLLGMTGLQIQFAKATADAGNVGMPEVLRDMRLLSAERIAAALALSTGSPWLPWTHANDVDMSGINVEGLYATEEAVPVYRGEGGVMYYVISDPVRRNVVRIDGQQKDARFLYSTPKTISQLFYRHFSSVREQALKAIGRGDHNAAFGLLLTEAVYQNGGVENIYFEPGPVAGQMFIQVEGVRRHLHSFDLERNTDDRTLGGTFGRLINLIALEVGASEANLSTSGALGVNLIPDNLAGRFDFRVELKKTYYGTAVVLRPFDLQADVADIDLLGFDQYTRLRMRRAIESPYGLIMVVGPTSSGKNTSAISLLYSTDPLERSIQTVEHPVEVRVASWMQHEIPSKMTSPEDVDEASRTITDSLMRSAPQILYWGESRNADALRRAIMAANTGHLTLTTYHATDVASALMRMRSESTRSGDKIDMATASDMIIGMLSQRLLRKLCPACKEEDDRPEVREVLNKNEVSHENRLIFRAKGCPRCSDTGYAGRVLAYEWFEPKPDVDLGRVSPAEVREQSHPGLYKSGLMRIAQGVTDWEEVNRVLRTKGADES